MNLVAARAGGFNRAASLTFLLAVIAAALLDLQLAPPSLGGAVRCCFSVGAVLALFFLRRQGVVRSALFAVALEVVGGCVAFTLVDVPFVEGHQAQIGRFAIAVYGRFDPRARR